MAMRNLCLPIFFIVTCCSHLHGQAQLPNDKQKKDIASLIEQYSQARETRDTVLLKGILAGDIDQLVSTGQWRSGIDAAVKGMQNSSSNNPGTRTLRIENMRLLNRDCAIVDCQYEIKNSDGSSRRMWSTFIIVSVKGTWKISAIRNMLPARP